MKPATFNFWLNIFLVPDYLWLIAEHFLAPEDDTRAMLQSCQPLKAALSAYLLDLRLLREVEIKVHDWFNLVACSTCHSLGYHLLYLHRGFKFYAQYVSGYTVLLWTGQAEQGIYRIVISPAQAPEVVTKLTIFPERNGQFRAYFKRDHQLDPSLNVSEYIQSFDLMEVLVHFKPLLTNQLKQMADEMTVDDNYDDDYFDNCYAPWDYAPSEFELGYAPANQAPVEEAPVDEAPVDEAPEVIPVEEVLVEDAPEVIIIEDEVIIPVEPAPDVIIIEDEAIILFD